MHIWKKKSSDQITEQIKTENISRHFLDLLIITEKKY